MNKNIKIHTQSSGKNEKPIIYQAANGAVELRMDMSKETVWANLNQIADIFNVQKAAVSKHLKNIFESGELDQRGTVSKMETVQIEGKRSIIREIEYYNLDALISVGYRVNSKQATEFRKWATKTLKEHITKGYTINKKMIGKNWEEFSHAVESAKKFLPKEYQALTGGQALDLAELFARTWLSLDAYDKQSLVIKKPTKKNVKLTAKELLTALSDLKSKLITKGEATELFATDRHKESLEGIVGNVMQSLGGKYVYETVEAKAAHLLYFVVKNHPFVDGNKRSGAFAFVWFL